jgi:hypothetical protein
MQGSFAVVCPDVAGLPKTTSPKNEIIDAFRRAKASVRAFTRGCCEVQALMKSVRRHQARRRSLSVTAARKQDAFPRATSSGAGKLPSLDRYFN